MAERCPNHPTWGVFDGGFYSCGCKRRHDAPQPAPRDFADMLEPILAMRGIKVEKPAQVEKAGEHGSWDSVSPSPDGPEQSGAGSGARGAAIVRQPSEPAPAFEEALLSLVEAALDDEACEIDVVEAEKRVRAAHAAEACKHGLCPSCGKDDPTDNVLEEVDIGVGIQRHYCDDPFHYVTEKALSKARAAGIAEGRRAMANRFIELAQPWGALSKETMIEELDRLESQAREGEK